MFPKKHILFISSWYTIKTNVAQRVFIKNFDKAFSWPSNASLQYVFSVADLQTEFEINVYSKEKANQKLINEQQNKCIVLLSKND